MTTKIHLPPYGNDPATLRWAKREGDVVAKGEPLLDLDFESSRVTFPSPCAGRLQTIVVHEGQDASGDAVVAVIDAAPEQEAALPPIDVCAACGVVRIDRATKCDRCGAAHGSRALSVPRATDAKWVSLECTFKCRMCGFVVPLNHVDVDGAVLCARCSLQQAFDVRGWVDALAFAHDVADGMVAEAGTKKVSAKLSVRTENALEITASPGHPLCERCHAPLDAEIAANGKGAMKCATCATSVAYAAPSAALSMTKGALRMVMASEHRTDRCDVNVQETPGAIAVHCPSCSAPLVATDASKSVVCKFCNTVSRIPDGVWFRMSGKPPVAEPIWLAFRGTSRARRDAHNVRGESDPLLQRLRAAAEEARYRRHAAHVAAEAEKTRVEDAQRADAERAASAMAERQRADAESAAKAIQSKKTAHFLWVFFGALFVVAIASVIVWQVFFPGAR